MDLVGFNGKTYGSTWPEALPRTNCTWSATRWPDLRHLKWDITIEANHLQRPWKVTEMIRVTNGDLLSRTENERDSRHLDAD